jgi:hypothetical protein
VVGFKVTPESVVQNHLQARRHLSKNEQGIRGGVTREECHWSHAYPLQAKHSGINGVLGVNFCQRTEILSKNEQSYPGKLKVFDMTVGSSEVLVLRIAGKECCSDLNDCKSIAGAGAPGESCKRARLAASSSIESSRCVFGSGGAGGAGGTGGAGGAGGACGGGDEVFWGRGTRSNTFVAPISIVNCCTLPPLVTSKTCSPAEFSHTTRQQSAQRTVSASKCNI